jgi:biotin carboxylase
MGNESCKESHERSGELMPRSILIFGAGINQYLLIKAANDLGLSSVVLDPNPNAPGKDIANHFYVVEGNDFQRTKEIALIHKVAGQATTQLEKPLRLMAQLAHEMNLLFHSPEVIDRSLDKWLMKLAFQRHQIPCAKGKLFKKTDTLTENDLFGFAYPIIIKPRDATSSQGVFRIERFEEIEHYIGTTRNFGSNGDILIEEFLEGSEYSIEAVTFRGITNVVQYTEKFITPFPNTVEMGHLQPADISDKDKNQINKVVTGAVNAIGIDYSATHTEIIMTNEGPKILEIGARGGGDFISSYLTFASTGVSLDQAIIKVALGEKPDLEHKQKKFSYIQYAGLPVGAEVLGVDAYNDVLSASAVVFAYIFVKAGDIIEHIAHSALRSACVLVTGQNRENAVNNADEYIDKLLKKIRIQ